MTRREYLVPQFEKVMKLWWRCVAEGRITPQQPAIETEFTEIAAMLGTDFYHASPEPGHPVFLPLLGREVPRSSVLRTPMILRSLNRTIRRQLKNADYRDGIRGYAYHFFDGLTTFEYASMFNPSVPSRLTSDWEVVNLMQPLLATAEKSRPELHQVQFNAARQRAVATNASIILAVPWTVEGQHTYYRTSLGGIPDTGLVFPEWENVIPLHARVESVPIPLQWLLNRLPGLAHLWHVSRWMSDAPVSNMQGEMRIGDLPIVVDSFRLGLTLIGLAHAGAERVVIRASEPEQPFLIVDADDPRCFACLSANRRNDPVGLILRARAARTNPPAFTGLLRA